MFRRALAVGLVAARGAIAQPAVTPAIPNAVTGLSRDPVSGDLMATMVNGAAQDIGIGNQRGNNNIQVFGTSGTLTVNCGTNKAFISGSASVASLTIQLSPCPRNGDGISVSSNVPIGQLNMTDAAGNPVMSVAMPVPYVAANMMYMTTWQAFTMPSAPYVCPVASASVPGCALSTAYDAAGAATSAVAALNLGTASQQPASAFLTPAQGAAAYYPLSSNPAGYVTSSSGGGSYYPLTSNPSGYITQAAITALNLGSASQQPSSAFATPAQVAAAYYPLSSNPASYLTSAAAGAAYYPLSSNPAGYLTACQAATGSISGCSKRFDVLGVSISTPAVTAVLGLIAAPVTVTVSGVALGDRTACNFASAPPGSFFVVGCQPSAANSVAVQFSTTSLLTLAATPTTINVTVLR